MSFVLLINDIIIIESESKAPMVWAVGGGVPEVLGASHVVIRLSVFPVFRCVLASLYEGVSVRRSVRFI